MNNSLVVALHEGKVLCAFPEKYQCIAYIKREHPNVDGFDVELKTKYLSDYQPSNDYFGR